jgi:hypothetical protein
VLCSGAVVSWTVAPPAIACSGAVIGQKPDLSGYERTTMRLTAELCLPTNFDSTVTVPYDSMILSLPLTDSCRTYEARILSPSDPRHAVRAVERVCMLERRKEDGDWEVRYWAPILVDPSPHPESGDRIVRLVRPPYGTDLSRMPRYGLRFANVASLAGDVAVVGPMDWPPAP